MFFSVFLELDIAFILPSEESIESYFEVQITEYCEFDQINKIFMFFSVFLDLNMAFILLSEASVESYFELQVTQYWEYD